MIDDFLYYKVQHYLNMLDEYKQINTDLLIEYFNFIKMEWEAFVYREDVTEKTFAGLDGHRVIAHVMGEAIFSLKPDFKIKDGYFDDVLIEDLRSILLKYKDYEFMKKNLNDYTAKQIERDFV